LFYSIKSKFYAIAVLLILSFSTGYAILAYFLHQQNLSASLTENITISERNFSELDKLFSEARFWEKSILLQKNPEAEKQFGITIEKIKGLLGSLNDGPLPAATKAHFQKVIKNISEYESAFNELIQLKIKQSLLRTRIETNYNSMVSMILNSNTPSLLKPLFNLTHFLIDYWSKRGPAKYQALTLVIASLEKKTQEIFISDVRMMGYFRNFKQMLADDYAMETRILAIDNDVEKLSTQLNQHFSQFSSESKAFLESKFQETSRINRKLQFIFLVSALMGTVFLLIILLIISKNIVTPIRTIASVMKKVQTGDLSARFQNRKVKNDEIIQFGMSFNEMLDTLEANNRKLINYHKELEAKLHEISDREAESQRLTAQLQRAQKMEAIGTLAGGVAHDLNNVLSGLVSYPEILLMDLPEDSPYRKPILTIQESGQKAAAIVQDLLTLARRGVAVTETTNVNDLVTNYLSSPEYEDLKRSLKNKIETKVSLDEKLFNIKGSPVHLTKTIMNLVSNAAESIKGNGTIAIQTKNRYIDSPIRGYDDVEEGDYVVLTVEDSGSGIAASDLDHIFEPFFTRKSMGRSGTGLGMAVVWGTVKDHNGYIDVHSKEEKGTLFRLYFPATRHAIETESLGASIEKLKGAGERVLIVDDVRQQREITAEMLTKLGYDATMVASGEEAVVYLQEKSVDLLVLDMIMDPGMNGLDTYKKVLEKNPHQKAIIASGFSEDLHVKEAQRLGAGDYIKKPFSLETLGTAVKKALRSLR
jgi:two-component system cell cycle sensor histidine kinase/response regulator CckA